MRKAVFIHDDGIPDGKDFEELTDEEIIGMYEDDPTYIWVYDSWDHFVHNFNNWDAPSMYTSHARMVDFPD